MAATVMARGRAESSEEVAELVERLHGVMRASLHRLQPALAAERITMGQFWALHLVSSLESASVSSVARHLGVSAPTVCGNLDQLDASGLVRRHRSDRDRRSVLLSLTPSGRQVEARIWGQIAGLVAEAARGIPPSDLEATVRVFRELERGLEAPPAGRGAR